MLRTIPVTSPALYFVTAVDSLASETSPAVAPSTHTVMMSLTDGSVTLAILQAELAIVPVWAWTVPLIATFTVAPLLPLAVPEMLNGVKNQPELFPPSTLVLEVYALQGAPPCATEYESVVFEIDTVPDGFVSV